MADTGHGHSITFATSGFSLNILGSTLPNETVESIATDHVGLTDGDHIPYIAGDLIEGGELVIRVECDSDYAAPLRTSETITFTWPVKSLTNGATWAFTGITTGYSVDELVTNQRQEATVTVKVAGNISKNVET